MQSNGNKRKTGLTRKQFFARMRKLGFKKAHLQMTRVAITYRNDDGVSVTVPKGHEQTFHILGDCNYSGIYTEVIGDRPINWGTPVVPSNLGMDNMLEVCLGLCAGEILLA